MNTNESLINQAVVVRLRELRGGIEMSLEDLAEKSGVPHSNLRRILKGQQDVGVADLSAIAGALGSTASAVVEEATRKVGGDDKAAQDAQYVLKQRRREALKKRMSVVGGTMKTKDPRDMTAEELDDTTLPSAANPSEPETLIDEPRDT